MARAWGQLGPASPDVNLSQFVDQLVILCIGGYSNNVATQYGDKGAVRVALVVITGPNAGLEVPDLMVFNSRVVSRLKGAVGSILPAAVTYGEGRGSQQPIDLVEVTANPQAMQLIGAWDDAHPGRVDQLLTDCISEHQAVQYREQHSNQQQRPNGGNQRNQWAGGNNTWSMPGQMAVPEKMEWNQPGPQHQQSLRQWGAPQPQPPQDDNPPF